MGTETNQNGQDDNRDDGKVRISARAKQEIEQLLLDKFPNVIKSSKTPFTFNNVQAAFEHYFAELEPDERPDFPFVSSKFYAFSNPNGLGVSIRQFVAYAECLKILLGLDDDCKYGMLTDDRPEEFKLTAEKCIGTLRDQTYSKPDTSPSAPIVASPNVEVSVAPPNVTVEVHPEIVFSPKIDIAVPKRKEPIASKRSHNPVSVNLVTLSVFFSTVVFSVSMLAGFWNQNVWLNMLILFPFLLSFGVLTCIQTLKLYHLAMVHVAIGENRNNWFSHSRQLNRRMQNPEPWFDFDSPSPVRLRVSSSFWNELLLWATAISAVAICMYVSTPHVQRAGLVASVAASSFLCVTIWVPSLLAYYTAFLCWFCRFNRIATLGFFLFIFSILWFSVSFAIVFAATPDALTNRGLFAATDFMLSPLIGLFAGNLGQGLASLVCFTWALLPAFRAASSLYKNPPASENSKPSMASTGPRPNIQEASLEQMTEEEKTRYMNKVFQSYFDENRIVVRMIQPFASLVYKRLQWIHKLRRPSIHD